MSIIAALSCRSRQICKCFLNKYVKISLDKLMYNQVVYLTKTASRGHEEVMKKYSIKAVATIIQNILLWEEFSN